MDAWLAILDQAGARELPHNDIWRWLADAGHVAEGGLREAIVITYEQQIGRREMGQSCYGDYPANMKKVLKGTMDDALQRWLELVRDDEHSTAPTRYPSRPSARPRSSATGARN